MGISFVAADPVGSLSALSCGDLVSSFQLKVTDVVVTLRELLRRIIAPRPVYHPAALHCRPRRDFICPPKHMRVLMRGQRIELQRVTAYRQFLLMRRTGRWTVDIRERTAV
jgi:hypothetical protein